MREAELLAAGAVTPESLAIARRQKRLGGYYAFEHYLLWLKSHWWTFLLHGIGTPAIYVLAFGVGIAVILTSRGTHLDGVTYLEFIGPALLLASAFQIAFFEGSYPVMGGFKWRGNYLVQANAGLTPAQTALGVLLFSILRVLTGSFGFLIILYLAGGLSGPGGLWVLPLALSLTIGMTSLAAAFGATIRDDRGQWNMLNRFVVMPLILFSGTYYPLEVLPAGMQWIGWLSPLWHATDLARIASYGLNRPVWLTAVHIAVVIALPLVGWLVMRRRFAVRLEA